MPVRRPLPLSEAVSLLLVCSVWLSLDSDSDDELLLVSFRLNSPVTSLARPVLVLDSDADSLLLLVSVWLLTVS